MNCPRCHHAQTRVIDSRPASDGSIRRRRICGACDHRFTTHERYGPQTTTTADLDRTLSQVGELVDRARLALAG